MFGIVKKNIFWTITLHGIMKRHVDLLEKTGFKQEYPGFPLLWGIPPPPLSLKTLQKRKKGIEVQKRHLPPCGYTKSLNVNLLHLLYNQCRAEWRWQPRPHPPRAPPPGSLQSRAAGSAALTQEACKDWCESERTTLNGMLRIFFL